MYTLLKLCFPDVMPESTEARILSVLLTWSLILIYLLYRQRGGE
jgi:hypothetical protein